MGAVVGNCSLANVMVVVTFLKGLLFYCCRSAIVKCMLCHGGSGID